MAVPGGASESRLQATCSAGGWGVGGLELAIRDALVVGGVRLGKTPKKMYRRTGINGSPRVNVLSDVLMDSRCSGRRDAKTFCDGDRLSGPELGVEVAEVLLAAFERAIMLPLILDSKAYATGRLRCVSVVVE
ncbi:hypothetical protein DL768_010526 [Monosporascus sp. mg162]|nr:hypothetical protein DL768_010526 [Monosporascus sp. mg162]